MVTSTVQVRQQSRFTLPAELRQKYGIQTGDTFRVIDLDGIFVFTPMTPIVPELAREIEKARLEAGLDAADLLRALREERAKYVQETYGDNLFADLEGIWEGSDWSFGQIQAAEYRIPEDLL